MVKRNGVKVHGQSKVLELLFFPVIFLFPHSLSAENLILAHTLNKVPVIEVRAEFTSGNFFEPLLLEYRVDGVEWKKLPIDECNDGFIFQPRVEDLFISQDLNLDGHNDLKFLYSQGSEVSNYCAYLYFPENREFKRKSEFDDIFNCNGRLCSFYWSKSGWSKEIRYTLVKGDRPVVTEEVEFIPLYLIKSHPDEYPPGEGVVKELLPSDLEGKINNKFLKLQRNKENGQKEKFIVLKKEGKEKVIKKLKPLPEAPSQGKN